MIIWLHQLIDRNLYANSGNTDSAQSYALLMSTGSEQQPMNPDVFALIQCQEWIKSGRRFCSARTATLPKAGAVFFSNSVSRAPNNKWNLKWQR
tara:strand:- start:198 stop:479 length:282 start_codon:yes stop_codon:yes gene_type:complete